VEADWTTEEPLQRGKVIEYKLKGGIQPEVRLKLKNMADKAIQGDRDALVKTLGVLSHISNLTPSIKPALAAVYKMDCYLDQQGQISWKEEEKTFLLKLVTLAERGSDTLKTGVNGPAILQQPAARITTDAADNVVVEHKGNHYAATVEEAYQVFVTEVMSPQSEQNIKEAFKALIP